MKQRTFEQQHQAQWQRLEQWLAELNKRVYQKSKLEVPVAQFATEYRQICQQLALAQSRHYTPQLIERLNHLVLQGHQVLYTRHPRFLYQISRFLIQQFPHTVRTEWRLITISTLLFFGSFLLMLICSQFYPDLIYSIASEEQVSDMEKMYNPQAERIGRESSSDFMMFGFYIFNNISVAFRTYASGLLFGIGSIFFILFNGIFIGSIAGHLTQIGYTETFWSFVAGHSAPELSAIVIAGAAGLKLGLALLMPGRYQRLYALRLAAQQGLPLVYGLIFLLICAAFIEAFWSSSTHIAPWVKYSVGLSLWGILITYLTLGGRHRAD